MTPARHSLIARCLRVAREHPVEIGVHALLWGSFIVMMATGEENGVGWFHQPEQSLWFPMIHGAIWNAVTFVGAGRLATGALQDRRWLGWLAGLARLVLVVLAGKTVIEWLYVQVAEPELRGVGLFWLGVENTYPLVAMVVLGSVYFMLRRTFGHGDRPRSITVKSGQATHRIVVDEIRYLKSEGNYVAFHAAGNPLLVLATMEGVLELLGDQRFLRVHRSYIVNLDRVTGLDSASLIIGDEAVPIGKTYRPAVRDRLRRRLGQGASG